MGPQTSLHPHNPSLIGHSGTFVPPGHPSFPTPHPSHPHQPWLDPQKTGQRPFHPSYKPLDTQAPMAYECQAQANSPAGIPSEQHGVVYHPRKCADALNPGGGMVVYPCMNYQSPASVPAPLSHSVEHQPQPALQPVNEVGHIFIGGASQVRATPSLPL